MLYRKWASASLWAHRATDKYVITLSLRVWELLSACCQGESSLTIIAQTAVECRVHVQGVFNGKGNGEEIEPRGR